MRVTFQCTYEDFREAHLGYIASVQPGSISKRPWRALVNWVVLLVLAVGAVLLIGSAPAPRVPPPAGWAFVVHFAKAIGPALFIVALAAAVSIPAVFRPSPKPWAPESTSKRGRRLISVSVFTILAGVFLVNFRGSQSGGAPDTPAEPVTSPRLDEYALGFLPVLFYILLGVGLQTLGLGPGLRRRWDEQPFLHRHVELDASDAGLVLEETLSRLSYMWDYFPGFLETPNLLLLYATPHGFWIIPKRAFTAPGELDAFKGLLMTHVSQGIFLPAQVAFPVLPPANTRM